MESTHTSANPIAVRDIPSFTMIGPDRQVANDLAIIFAPLPTAHVRVLETIIEPVSAPPTTRFSRAKWRWLLIALLIAILVDLLAGLVVSGALPSAKRELALTARISLSEPAVPAIDIPVRSPPPADFPKVAPDVHAPSVPSASRPVVPARPAPVPEEATERPPSTNPGAACRGTAAWCLRDDVVAADRRLRDAYAVAGRVGVDRSTLRDVRSDWARLRRIANKEPERLIRGYAILTDVLRRSAEER